MKQKNSILVRGTVTRTEVSRRVIHYTVATDGGGNATAYPDFVLFLDTEAGSKRPEIFMPGDRVVIKAHVQNRLPRRDENGNKVTKFLRYFAIDEISRAERLLSEYVDDNSMDRSNGGVQEDLNRVIFAGEVTHVYSPRRGTVYLTLAAETDGYRNFCNITCYRRQADEAAKCKEGDSVAAVGAIAARRLSGEDASVFDTVVCKDISRLSGSNPDENDKP